MLTNLFYYGYYKPYIFKDDNKDLIAKKNINEIVKNSTGSKHFSFFLNKALKDEIIKYASNISSDYNSIKSTALFVFDRINRNEGKYEDFKQDLCDGMFDFVNQYNEYRDFSNVYDKNSKALNEFAENLKDRVYKNEEFLEEVGIHINEDGFLFFNKDKFDSMNKEELYSKLGNLRQFCKDIYNDTCKAMEIPMSNHMNFRDLNYYYSYVFALVEPNTFKIVQEGMLVDIAL